MKIFLVLFTAFLLFSCATKPVTQNNSELTYNYATLKLLDLDDMSDLIQKRVIKYQKTGDEALLREAVEISFYRPDEDALIEKLTDDLRAGFDSEEQWEQVREAVIDRNIARLKNETTAPVDQVTYLISLENFIAQFKPDFIRQYKGPLFETEMIEKIAAAEIVVSDEAADERRLNLMSSAKSPSAMAGDLIKERQKALGSAP